MEQQLPAKLKMKSAWRHQKHSLILNVSTIRNRIDRFFVQNVDIWKKYEYE